MLKVGGSAKERFVEFRGVMRQVAGSETMWMRFGLQERLGDRPFARTRVPGLSAWRKSRPGVLRFVHRQRVLGLAEGSKYRARVRFRWYDADGNLVKETVRRSPSCRQGGELPNLVVKQIRARPVAGPPGVQRYEVRVVNRGGAAVAGADLALAVDAAALDTVAVGSLEPGESTAGVRERAGVQELGASGGRPGRHCDRELGVRQRAPIALPAAPLTLRVSRTAPIR